MRARYVILTSVFLLPLVTSAQLVPCTDNCNFDDLITLVQRVIDFLIKDIASPIAALMFVYAGYLYLTAGDETEKVSTARQIFISVFWGYVIILGAWLIVRFILNYLTSSDYSLLGP